MGHAMAYDSARGVSVSGGVDDLDMDFIELLRGHLGIRGRDMDTSHANGTSDQVLALVMRWSTTRDAASWCSLGVSS